VRRALCVCDAPNAALGAGSLGRLWQKRGKGVKSQGFRKFGVTLRLRLPYTCP